MGLVETAGPAYASATTNAVSTAAFTPTASGLLVAIVAIGNGNGKAATNIGISDNLGGAGWTLLTQYLPTTSSGGGAIWVQDAISVPTSGTILATVAPTTVLDLGIIIRQFSGAMVAASQNGQAGSATGTIDSISITPNATGSQIVGGFGIDGGNTRTANGTTTIYNQTKGNAGDQFGVMEANTLTTSGVAQILGYTATHAQSGIFAVEILASIAAAFVPQSNRYGEAGYCYPMMAAVRRAGFY